MMDEQNNNFESIREPVEPVEAVDSMVFTKANFKTKVQTIEGLKDEAIKAVEGFLSTKHKTLGIEQTNLSIEGSAESYTKLMKELNKVMDARCAIFQHEIEGPAPLGQQLSNTSKILIRDARHTNGTKPEDLAESWMEVMAAQARGAVSLLDMNEVTKLSRGANDADVRKSMVKTFGVYCERVRGAASPKERKKIVTEFNQELAGALQNHGLVIGGEELSKMKDAKVIQIMGDARDFCNLGEKDQSHVITISEDFEGKGNFIWASMKMNPLSEAIKAEYEQVRSYKNNRDSGIHQTPEWFINMKPHQRELTLEYLDQIMDGNHALPTQLRFLPGLKNAFADIKGFALNGNIDSKESYVECHSGTLVHNAGSENSKEAKRVTELNMRHVKELVGDKTLVLSVLNTNSILQPIERNICKISAYAASKVSGVESNQNGVNLVALNPDRSLKRIEKFSALINKSKDKIKMLWTACKSGKDRTFALLMRGASIIFGGDKSKEFIEMLSKTNHAEVMASGAGATRGAYGLKLKEMFIRMKDAVLGTIRGRLTNTISGVNVLHTTKLHGDSIYKKMLNEERSKNNLQEPKKLAGKDELTKIQALEVGHALQETLASESKIVVPAAPNAARPRARSL